MDETKVRNIDMLNVFKTKQYRNNAFYSNNGEVVFWSGVDGSKRAASGVRLIYNSLTKSHASRL